MLAFFRSLQEIFMPKKKEYSLSDLCNQEYLKKSLQVTALARKAAQRDIQARNDIGLLNGKQKIIKYFEEFLVAHRAEFLTSHENIKQQQLQCNIRIYANKVHDVETNFTRDWPNFLNTISYKLDRKLLMHDSVTADLNVFKENNNLTDIAKSLDPFPFIAGTYLACVTLETIGNSFFFAASHPGGYLGAFSQSLLISTLNVLLGFILGYAALRNFFHVKIWRKVLAGILLFLISLTAIMFNLLVAHYRANLSLAFETLGNVSLKASQDAVRTFIDNPILILNFDSWMLFAIGILVFVVAAWKGIFVDDPYPAYGKIFRRFEKSLEELNNTIDEAGKEVRDKVDNCINELNSFNESAKAKVSKYINLINIRKKKTEEFTELSVTVERECNKLLRFFRSEYLKINQSEKKASWSNHNFGRLNILPTFNEDAESKQVDEFNFQLMALEEKIEASKINILEVEKEGMELVRNYRKTQVEDLESATKPAA